MLIDMLTHIRYCVRTYRTVLRECVGCAVSKVCVALFLNFVCCLAFIYIYAYSGYMLAVSGPQLEGFPIE